MKKLFTLIFIGLFLCSSLSLLVLATSSGWGHTNPEGNIEIEVRKATFFDKIIEAIKGLFAVSGLQTQYELGDTIDVTVYSKLLYGTACEEGFLVMEIYNAPRDQQTRASYVGGKSHSIGLFPVPGVTYSASMSYTIPTSSFTNSFGYTINPQPGTWSISGYIYCPSISGDAANYNVDVNELNFGVGQTAEPECMSDSDCGTDGYVGSLFCKNNDVYQNYKTYHCKNPGQITADCTSSTEARLIEDCKSGYICSNGVCVKEEICTDTCESLGYECGTHIICGTSVDCGPCPEGYSCSDGKCIKEEQTEGKIQLISKSVSKVGQDTIQGTFKIKNIGTETVSGILEMQVNPYGEGVLAVIETESVISVCDTLTPRNVHKSYSLNPGDETTITLTSPLVGTIADGNYRVFVLTTKGCAVDYPVGYDRSIPTEPVEFGNFVGVKVGTFSIDTGTGEICGNDKCERYELERGNCYDDCEEEFTCNNDGFCSSIENCECSDCLTAERCDFTTDCAVPIKHISKIKSETIAACAPTLIGFFNPFKVMECQIALIKGIVSGAVIEETPICSRSLTKEEFKKATDYEILYSICEENRNCAPRKGYDVDCVPESTAGIKIPTDLGEKLAESIFGKPSYGVCLAKETEKKDICDFLSKIAIVSITGDDCTDGGITIFGGFILLMMFFQLMSAMPKGR